MGTNHFRGRRWIVRLLAATLGTLASIHGDAQVAEPFSWSYSAPEEQGVDSEALARLLMLVQRDKVDLDSFILVRHGRIVAEAYTYPYTATRRHVLHSASKSFTSALVGIAIHEGLFNGVHDRVTNIFEGVTTAPPSLNLSQMTLRHMLTMSTGHATDTTFRIIYTPDWVRSFLNLPVENTPGAPFVYNSGATFMLSAAIQQRAGVNAATYARSRLFEPLGITDWTWDVAPGNITTGGWGLSLRPLDMAKFGLLYLHGGAWEGRQLVPAAWVAESGRKQVETGPSGTFWESGYGYQFWINDAAIGGYRADGALGQYIMILPEHDAVIVFTANLPENWIPADLARAYVVPALRSVDTLPANPKANALVARFGAVLEAAPGASAAAPLFTSLPEDQAVAPGGTASFSVTVSGSPTPSIQWYHDGVAVPGATATTLTVGAATRREAGEYTAVAHNTHGVLVSLPVSLEVLAAPEIRRAPASLVVAEGDSAMFCVSADGDDLRYAWRHDGVVIAGATGTTLCLSEVEPADAGSYDVVVSNAHGAATSGAASLTLAAVENAPRLSNLSIRGLAGDGDRTLIIGFSVAGADAATGLPVLLRGIGPTLSDYDVAAPLADPAVILHAGSEPIAVNADWRGDTLLRDSGVRVGAFGLPRASADAALLAVLKPRTYTMHVVSSLPAATGIALAECYDAADSAVPGGGRLVNVSARAATSGGEGTLIAGFVVAGSRPMRLLVRGIGPGLAEHGVGGWLEDPELRLYSGGTVIAQNDDWGGDVALREAFSRTGAFDLGDAASDAALLIDLAPGAYTAHVSGREGGQGVALVEVYAVPD